MDSLPYVIEMISRVLLVVGALNWGLVAFGFNIVAFVAQYTFASLEPVIYILVGVSALFHIMSRNFYLPFLGDAAFPCGAMTEKTPSNPNSEVKIHIEPLANVIYWAAESNGDVAKNPWIAYAEHTNAGVTRSDVNGVASLKFRTPRSYNVFGGMKTLKPHVHYRVCKAPGILSEIKTVFL